MKRPLLLDFYCCAGGAAKGYYDAGFDVVGVDIEPKRHYPYECYEGDALEVADILLDGKSWHGYRLTDFQAWHGSPECKGYSDCNLSPRELYQRQIVPVRQRFQASGLPYVIENVRGATDELHASLMLCSTMFGLPMERHRWFESNVFMYPPCTCDHSIAHIAVYGHSVWDSWLEGTPRKDGRKRPDSVSIEVGRAAMQCPWMNIEELAEALPPAYTAWIGTQLLNAIAQTNVA